MKPVTKTLVFAETEHEGDIERYAEDLRAAGARVLRWTVNEDTETGEITIEAADWADFTRRFRRTEAAEFCEGARR